METATPSSAAGGPPPPDDKERAEAIGQCLVHNLDLLLSKAHYYVLKTRLASGAAAQELAREVVQDLAQEALGCAARLDLSRPTLRWLKGILLNLLKRRRDQIYQHNRRTIYRRDGSAQEDEELFDWLAGRMERQPDAEAMLSGNEWVREVLEQLDPLSRETFELSILHELNAGEMAQRLGITANAVRQRLHRMMKKLKPFRRGAR